MLLLGQQLHEARQQLQRGGGGGSQQDVLTQLAQLLLLLFSGLLQGLVTPECGWVGGRGLEEREGGRGRGGTRWVGVVSKRPADVSAAAHG